MATHQPSTAPVTSASGDINKTNTASMLMEDDTFDLDDAALAAAVDSIIENHNKESEKVRRERARERRRQGRALLSPFSIDIAGKRTQRDPNLHHSTPTTPSSPSTRKHTNNQTDGGRRSGSRRRHGCDDGSKREPTATAAAATAQGFWCRLGCCCRPSFPSADNAPRCRRRSRRPSFGSRSPGSGCSPSAAAFGSRRGCFRAA